MTKSSNLPSDLPTETGTQHLKIDLSKPVLKDAITQGLLMIADGKTKADAARLIFSLIKDEGKDVIVAVFIEGATLTPKGALTYWYNCRRRAAKDAKKKSAEK